MLLQSEVDSSLIQRGFWINHSIGPVLGATLTLDQQYANAIIALVAVVVATAASSAWNLLLFTIHQLRVTDELKDGLYWQQQALYRTLSTPGTVVMDSLKLLCIWRRKASSPILKRCMTPALIGLFFVVGGLAAGIFSSYIVTTTDLEVLINGEGCRFLNWTTYTTGANGIPLDSALDVDARSFAERCYTPGPLPSQCNFYIHPRIEPTLSFVDCPFEPEVCMNGTDAALLDSGFLDSNDIFGINAPPQDRVLVRRQATCVPLDTPRYTSYTNSSSPIVKALGGADRYDSSLQQVNDWWVYSLGSIEEAPDNLTMVHSTLASNATDTYALQWVERLFALSLYEMSTNTWIVTGPLHTTRTQSSMGSGCQSIAWQKRTLMSP